jgi:flagellar basal-body rod protein FlgF
MAQEQALSHSMEMAAHNIANVNTTGFKSTGLLFDDYLTRTSDPKFSYHMPLDVGTYHDATNGKLVSTDNPLDLAISGPGFFGVQTPQGAQYTRAGSFQLDADGNLVTPDGFPVLSGGGQPVTIPPGTQQISVGNDGTISTENGTIGRLQLVHFQDEQKLQPTYGGLYSTTETPEVDNASALYQGMVESSNVKPVIEMTRVIDISRSYQRISGLIEAEHQRIRDSIRQLGKIV